MAHISGRQTQQITRRGFLSARGTAALSFSIVVARAVAGTEANDRVRAAILGREPPAHGRN